MAQLPCFGSIYTFAEIATPRGSIANNARIFVR
jgi:hypothetical protein